MSRPNPAILFGFFVALIVAICGASLAKGGLYLGKHEGDMLHLADIVLRMAAGAVPHQDFMTPIGILAFWPLVEFVQWGFGIGMSVLLAQMAFSVLILPALFWASYSRLDGLAAYLFGAFVIVLVTALVHGEGQSSISVSMHYNRWAWAVSFVVLILAMMPGRPSDNATIDGLFIGTGMFVLMMIKVTYFGAFALPLLVALVVRRAYPTLLIALATGLGLMALTTFLMGLSFWTGYLGDLLIVAASDARPYPSESFQRVIGAPEYLGGSLLLLFTVIALRRSGFMNEGLVLLLLMPGFFYVTYQNFGNDPQWMFFLVIVLMAHRPEAGHRFEFGTDMRNVINIAAAFGVALVSVSFVNMSYSSLRHLVEKEEDFTEFFPRSEQHDDLFADRLRSLRVDQRGPFLAPGTVLDEYQDIEEALEPTIFQGETLPSCAVELGMLAWFDAVVQDLEQAGYAGNGQTVFAADFLPSFWLFGGFAPLEGAAPWYYGGLPGFENADYLIVPTCALALESRATILEAVEDSGVTVEEVRRTPLYILYSIPKAA